MEQPRCRGLNLQAFLIKPLQRLTKYPLLLTELSKNTPDTFEDKKPLERALGKIVVRILFYLIGIVLLHTNIRYLDL